MSEVIIGQNLSYLSQQIRHGSAGSQQIRYGTGRRGQKRVRGHTRSVTGWKGQGRADMTQRDHSRSAMGQPRGRKVRAGQTWVGYVTTCQTRIREVTAGQTRGRKISSGQTWVGEVTVRHDDDDDWGFRARRLQRSFCAHNYRIITPQRERKIKNVCGR